MTVSSSCDAFDYTPVRSSPPFGKRFPGSSARASFYRGQQRDEASRSEIPVAASDVLVRFLLLPMPVYILLLKIAPVSLAGMST